MKSLLCPLILVLALAAGGCNRDDKKKEEEGGVVGEPEVSVEGGQLIQGEDMEMFLVQLREGVRNKDYYKLAPLMTEDFGYQLNPDLSGEGVFQYWDERNLWPQIDAIVHQPFVFFNGFYVAPPEFEQEKGNYKGMRTGIVNQKGKWKWAYCVP